MHLHWVGIRLVNQLSFRSFLVLQEGEESIHTWKKRKISSNYYPYNMENYEYKYDTKDKNSHHANCINICPSFKKLLSYFKTPLPTCPNQRSCSVLWEIELECLKISQRKIEKNFTLSGVSGLAPWLSRRVVISRKPLPLAKIKGVIWL